MPLHPDAPIQLGGMAAEPHAAGGGRIIMKEPNPKDIVGAKKAPLRLVPPALLIAVAPVMANGADKYGAYNWRRNAIRATSYTEAAMRHLLAWQDGEDTAEDSGHSHLAHAAACLAILLDAESTPGCLIDDRPTPGPAAALLADLDHTDGGR